MFRFLHALVLIPALLISQTAGMLPHFHCGMSAEERVRHDATPHVHPHIPGHVHSHGTDDAGHEHEPCDSVPPEPGESRDGVHWTPAHDHGAIQLPGDWLATGGRRISEEMLVLLPGDLDSAVLASIPGTVSKEYRRERPPDTVRDESHIWLTLRTLRL